MLHTQKDAENFTIPGGVEGVLYPPGPDDQFSIAVVEQDGIYPQQGWSMNDVCTETFYMLEGAFEVDVDDKSFTIKQGDVLSVEPGQKYRVRGKGRSVDLITPAWDKKQNHILKDDEV